MSLSTAAIERPVATTLLTLALALAGVVAFKLLPVAPLPQVEFPTIQVSAALPGASPETMASSVAAPLERQFGRIAGVTEMTSTSFLGTTSLVLQFDLGRNIDGAARDVQAAINAARGFLPPSLPSNPIYRKINPAEAPVLILALTSQTVSTPRLYDAAASILQQKLAQVSGVGQVVVGGSSLPAVRVELNPTALAKYGVGLEEVRAMLAATNQNRPLGILTNQINAYQLDINDQLRRAEQYRPLIVAMRGGVAVRLSDIAETIDSMEDVRNAGIVNGQPAVLVIVFRQPGANIIDTVDRVRALLPELQATLPGGVLLSAVLDRTPTIRGSLHDVLATLVISAILVVLVVFVFLKSLRATLVPALVVPVSLIGTFSVMYLLGFSLNNLSLMALTIATGFVVDDAIVVLENTSRHIEAGLTPREAALAGVREIAFTVLSMSISLVAVFLPILLMGGMLGRLFREFAVTLSVAILVSMALSLTTTPMMCARLLRKQTPRAAVELAVGAPSHRGLRRTHHLVRPKLELGARSCALDARGHLGDLGAHSGARLRGSQGVFPAARHRPSHRVDLGRSRHLVSGDADQGDRHQPYRERRPRGRERDGVSGGGTARNTARMFISLRPLGVRRLSADQVIARLRPRLAEVAGASTFLQAVQDLRIGGAATASQFQYVLQSEDVKTLATWAPRVEARLRALPQVVDLATDQQNGGMESLLAIDRASLARLGLTTELVDDTLYDAFGQRQVSLIYTLLNQYRVVMEVAPRFWQSPASLRDVSLTTPTGGAVPLDAVVRSELGATTLSVAHRGQAPAVTLSFNLGAGVSLGDAVQAITQAVGELGLPTAVRQSFSGTAQAFQQSLSDEGLLIVVALGAVYVVLGILYESYVHPSPSCRRSLPPDWERCSRSW